MSRIGLSLLLAVVWLIDVGSGSDITLPTIDGKSLALHNCHLVISLLSFVITHKLFADIIDFFRPFELKN